MIDAAKDLAAAINQEHRFAEQSARAAIGHALEAGRLLVEAKAQIGHGGWLPWLADHFEGSTRSAQNYMRLHQHRAELESKARSVAHLGVGEALKLLSAPKDGATEPDSESKPLRWTARSPADNAKQVAKWPDLIDAPTRLYMAMGRTIEEVAAVLGVDADLVEKRLDPRAPIRMHRGDWLTPSDVTIYNQSVRGLVDFHHHLAFLSASYLAAREAPHLVATMKSETDRHYRRSNAGAFSQFRMRMECVTKLGRKPEESSVWLAVGLQLDAAAIADYRAALGLGTVDESADLAVFADSVLSLDVAGSFIEGRAAREA